MLKTVARIVLVFVIPILAFATPTKRDAIELQVVSSQTKIHGSPPGEVFQYTNIMFTHVNGKNVIYECVQRGNLCPVVESGKTYSAEREGDFIYMAMSLPDGKHVSAKFKQLGTW